MSWWRTVLGLTRLVPELDHAGGDDAGDLWDGGRYRGARWLPIHPGRVGGAIKPWLVVVHTTDMHPASFGALARAWQRDAGRGAGAHFLLGRSSAEGLLQLADVGRNGNHAGGPGGAHGWIDVAGRRVHPNAVSIGIEVHCAGAVRQVGPDWLWRAGTKNGAGVWEPHGAPLPDVDVEPDPKRPGRGWHRPSAYQLGELAQLLGAIGDCPVRVPPPPLWRVEPHDVAHVQAWAPQVAIGGVPVVGHVTLDPSRKSDPGPVLSRWLTAAGAARQS